MLCLASCGTQDKGRVNEFIPLGNGESLNIGLNESYTNWTDEETVEVYMDYVAYVTYSLNRVYWPSYNGPVPDNYFLASTGSSYYFYWSVETVEETQLLGNKTAKTEYTYSYLPYNEDNSIVVRTNAVTTYSYDYQGGFIEKEIEYIIDLNGYFISFDEVKESYPELANAAYTGNTSDKYYVKIDNSKDVYTDTNNFTNTYYYITVNSKH